VRAGNVIPVLAFVAVLQAAVATGASGAPSGRVTARGTSAVPEDISQRTVAARLFPGDLLIADRGNNRLLLVGPRKYILWRYPRRGTSPTFPFHFDDDAFFSPKYTKIISNQEEQQTIQVISFPRGKVVWHYGHVDAAGSAPGYLHTPDDAYILPGGTRTVADVGNCRVLFISPTKHVLKQYGHTGVCRHQPPRYLASPNGDTPTANGGTLITEIGGSYVDEIGPRGHLLWSVRVPVAYPSDAQLLPSGRILVTGYTDPGTVLIMGIHGHVYWRYHPTSGPGMLNHPSLALSLPGGLIAVNDDYRDRVVLIDWRTHKIVWQYGHTDVAGSAARYLNTPDGMDFLPSSEVPPGP
jgi:hypothetical protein